MALALWHPRTLAGAVAYESGASLRAIARELAARGVPTARGGKWHAVQVADILRRHKVQRANA